MYVCPKEDERGQKSNLDEANKMWKKLNWDKGFSRITFRPRVEVEIKGTGLIH
ncbi:hypothetical protein P9578_10920 [Brevibacillus choshinensis]|uniref:hypothetical protein n=1 Tax=Brevibacillus choshinensis TaxID=54911 RepID=UPI002E1B5D54|nr:hypothetical protein [Brevibacillus choshinensis]MED4782823.1 hypothetical protein [Brevibacillus choshinensis]